MTSAGRPASPTRRCSPLYERLIASGAWWDHTRRAARSRVGELLRRRPGCRDGRWLRAWQTSPDRVGCGGCRRHLPGSASATTPTARLLTEAIEADLFDADFFLRKAIGWALRDFAKSDPAWVRRFLATHPGLSPLSVREASKRL